MTFIISGERTVNGQGSFRESEKILTLARRKNLRIETLEIVTLAKRWEDKLSPREFKSGASVMAAVEKGRKLLQSRKADLVIIRGTDNLKTGYAPGARDGFMKLYAGKYTPLDGYDRLVPLFLKAHQIKESEYFEIREELFGNYLRTWLKIHPDAPLPDKEWFSPLTRYFRGVDCANPNIDYSAMIILSEKKAADTLGIPQKKRVKILANAFTKLPVDGFASLPRIAPYLHLKKAIRKTMKEAKVDFSSEFLKGRALLDAYTCYPVVPMGLLLSLELVKTPTEMKEFLNKFEITVTGGLNLAKAPWNLTSLNALIVMRERLLSDSKKKLGMVHGNGSLGNQQGITILARPTTSSSPK